MITPVDAKACFCPTALYGVIGWPLGQSLSPLLHNTGFQALGIPAVYLRWEIAPERLAAFIDSMRLLAVQGCSVTIPHKMALMPLLDEVSPQARLAEAANTVYRRDGRLCGENTDVAGFLAPLADAPLESMDVLLLGAGRRGPCGRGRACGAQNAAGLGGHALGSQASAPGRAFFFHAPCLEGAPRSSRATYRERDASGHARQARG